MPFYGLPGHADKPTLFLHEGAKAARRVIDMIAEERCDEEPCPGEKGRGTEISTNRILVRIKSREEKLLNRGERETGPFSVPRPLFDLGAEYPPLLPSRANATTAPLVRDKDFVPFDATYRAEGERPWQEQDREQVRYLATAKPARLLSKAVRQAAGRDSGLVWLEATRSYCRRSATPPHPSLPAYRQEEGGGVES